MKTVIIAAAIVLALGAGSGWKSPGSEDVQQATNGAYRDGRYPGQAGSPAP